MLELAFKSLELRRLCLNQQVAKEAFGEEIGGKLMDRIGDLRAADNPLDHPTAHLSRIEGDRMEIPIDRNVTIVLCANHNQMPLDKNNNVDWKRVYRIKITSIGDFK